VVGIAEMIEVEEIVGVEDAVREAEEAADVAEVEIDDQAGLR
jgi:hypothetical protein